MDSVRKAVFLVAGMGTRLLPVTKTIPKEMLPVVDKPLIQYAVEEAVESGITELIFVTGRNKKTIEDYFGTVPELESYLQARNKFDILKTIRGILPKNIHCIYTRQSEPLGIGHAVLAAEPMVGNEPFAVLLVDDLIDARVPVLKQLKDAASIYRGSVLAVSEVPQSETSKYGIVEAKFVDACTGKIKHIVEKPKPGLAPSNLAVVGRYILDPTIFSYLHSTKKGAGNEIQLTDGISSMSQDHSVFAYCYEGHRYDCGSKLGLYRATLAIGSKYHGFACD